MSNKPTATDGVQAIRTLYSLIGDEQDKLDHVPGDSLPPATLPELCGELAGVLGVLKPSQWQAQCQVRGMMAVAYSTHGTFEWLGDAQQLLDEAEQVGVLSMAAWCCMMPLYVCV